MSVSIDILTETLAKYVSGHDRFFPGFTYAGHSTKLGADAHEIYFSHANHPGEEFTWTLDNQELREACDVADVDKLLAVGEAALQDQLPKPPNTQE